jgi:protocatechuate 3,4-dioxygenase beta subunit
MNTLYQQHKTQLVPTSGDIEGPFYKAGAPFCYNLRTVEDWAHPPLQLHGSVMAVDGTLLSEVVLDFWQADSKGVYDNDGFNFRGKVRSHKDGTYNLETIRPGDYQIDVNEFRCSHIHVKVKAPGFVPLTTQLYFSEDQYNATDHWFDKRRVIGEDGRFDFVLAKADK